MLISDSDSWKIWKSILLACLVELAEPMRGMRSFSFDFPFAVTGTRDEVQLVAQ